MGHPEEGVFSFSGPFADGGLELAIDGTLEVAGAYADAAAWPVGGDPDDVAGGVHLTPGKSLLGLIGLEVLRPAAVEFLVEWRSHQVPSGCLTLPALRYICSTLSRRLVSEPRTTSVSSVWWVMP